MMYFDCAATSFQKPPAVRRAMHVALQTCAGYARGGHAPALCAAEVVYDCRMHVATLLGAQPEQIIFTMNATHALNLAIHALCNAQTTVAVSGYEHNAVMRPLHANKVPYFVLKSALFDADSLLESAQDALKQGIRLFIINHASNVYGNIVPLAQLDALLCQYGARMILDASQSAGHMPIDLSRLPSIIALCTAGHKGLMGPMGTGVLVVRDDTPWSPLLCGGTGSLSASFDQPQMLPDRLESGTPNVVGIAGLDAGVCALLDMGVEHVQAHENKLTRAFCQRITTLTPIFDPTFTAQCAVVSVTSAKIEAETLADLLAERGVCVRAGLHCAPLAHQNGGTIDQGTVRFSFGAYNQLSQIGKLEKILKEICANY